MSDRVKSGLDLLDSAIGGGFKKNSVTLLAGNPGTGKTILSSQFLQEGASHGEKGLMVSFSETHDEYIDNMKGLGMDFESMENSGLFKFLDFATVNEEGIAVAVDIILKELDQQGVKRLVLDSLSAMFHYLEQKKARTFMHTLMGRTIKNKGITSIMISEVPYGEFKTDFSFEEFVSDGIIFLKNNSLEGKQSMTLEILKMRGVQIDNAKFEYTILPEDGGLRLIALPVRNEFSIPDPLSKIASGIEGIDSILEGGLLKGSITLIDGPGGLGKTTLCTQFLLKHARDRKPSLYMSFEEPKYQLTALARRLSEEDQSYDMHFSSHIPEALSPLKYLNLFRDTIATYRPEVMVIDSLTAIQETVSPTDFIRLLRYLQLLIKQNQLTVLCTSTSGSSTPSHPFTAPAEISLFSDNIIKMRYTEKNGQLGKEMTAIKTRNSPHDHRIHPYTISKRGLEIA